MKTSYTSPSPVPTSWKLIYRVLGAVIVIIFMVLMSEKIDHFFYGTRPLVPFVGFCTLAAFAGAVALWHIGTEYRIVMLLAHVGYGAVFGGMIGGALFCTDPIIPAFYAIGVAVGIPCNVLSAICIGTLKEQAQRSRTRSSLM